MPNHFWSSERVQTKKRPPAATRPVSAALSNGAERTGSVSAASRCRVVPSAGQAEKFAPSSPTRTGRATGVTTSGASSLPPADALPFGTGSPQAESVRLKSRRRRRMVHALWRGAWEKSTPGRRQGGGDDGLLADEVGAGQLRLGGPRARRRHGVGRRPQPGRAPPPQGDGGRRRGLLLP